MPLLSLSSVIILLAYNRRSITFVYAADSDFHRNFIIYMVCYRAKSLLKSFDLNIQKTQVGI